MNDLLNEEQLNALKDEAKDTIFRFLKATEKEPVKQDATTPTPGFEKAYKEIIVPFATKYPSYFQWFAQAVADARAGNEIQYPVHNNYVWVSKVFSAAKEVKLIPADLPETDLNLVNIRGLLSILNEVYGS